MSLRAVLFDLDDTLYGYAPCNEIALAAAHEVLRARLEVSREKFRACHDEVRRELARELAGQAASHNRVLFFKRIVERLMGPGETSLALELFDTYWAQFLAKASPAPDAHAVLTELSARHPLALVSNHTTDIQLRKLRALDFERYFSIVVTSEEAGIEKPDPRIFELALRGLDCRASEAVMVGDSRVVDGEGARRAGLRAILTREFVDDDVGAFEFVANLSELPALLRAR